VIVGGMATIVVVAAISFLSRSLREWQHG